MSAGSQVKDENQEYQLSQPIFITPAGHEISTYDTPDNQRLVVRHTTGSHVEFKTDGSVFIKSVKDMHVHGSALSEDQASAGGLAKEGDASSLRFDKDLVLEVGGTLHIKARKLEMDISESSNWISGTENTITANNITEKAFENIALQGTKSIYVDTKEYKERSVVHKQEEGTMEDGGQGGMSILNVHGQAIIQNDDPNGGITIRSRGYLNLVAGAERVDVVGQYTRTPGNMALGTYTTQVFAPSTGALNVSQRPGDYIFQSASGAHYTYALQTPGSTTGGQAVGLNETVLQGDRIRNVSAGNETVNISGMQRTTAQKIFLN